MVLHQSLPSSAEAYARDQRLEIQAALAAVQRQWRRMGPEFDASYAQIEGNLLAITDLAQSRVAAGAQLYIPAVLAETGQKAAVAPRFDVLADSLVGTAGDGMPTDSLLYGAVTHAKSAVGAGSTMTEALSSSSAWLSMAVGTLLSDTGRASEKLATMARPVTGFVRMLNPPSCGRCVELAGKRTFAQVAFRRHPGCDCKNIPASESVAGDLTVDPRAYFDSLDPAGQARMMGSQANAAAVRDNGADINQIINAYRKGGGVSSAQVYGKTVKYTTEGTTRRGLAYSQMRTAGYAQAQADVRAKGARYFATRAPRLMPESIAQIATSKADQERLLRLYGWIGPNAPRVLAATPRVLAARVVAAATAAEPGLTARMTALASQVGGSLAGLEYRLKTVKSLTKKITDDALADGKTAQQVADHVFDVNRYTILLKPDQYARSTQAAIDQLRADGNAITVKNYWRVPLTTNPYQGINVQITKQGGQRLELQFHTEVSLHVKEHEMHGIYDLKKAEKDPVKLAEYKRQSIAAAEKIPVPRGVAAVS